MPHESPTMTKVSREVPSSSFHAEEVCPPQSLQQHSALAFPSAVAACSCFRPPFLSYFFSHLSQVHSSLAGPMHVLYSAWQCHKLSHSTYCASTQS